MAERCDSKGIRAFISPSVPRRRTIAKIANFPLLVSPGRKKDGTGSGWL